MSQGCARCGADISEASYSLTPQCRPEPRVWLCSLECVEGYLTALPDADTPAEREQNEQTLALDALAQS